MMQPICGQKLSKKKILTKPRMFLITTNGINYYPNLGFTKIHHEEKPFIFVGLDYMGPLTIHDERTPTKNWICLFTCLRIRAIHLEVVNNMSTESFLLCMRRFISRRGKPQLIISDNANQIKLGCDVLKKVWNDAVKNDDT